LRRQHLFINVDRVYGIPAPTGTWAPTIPFPPKNPLTNMCMEPPIVNDVHWKKIPFPKATPSRRPSNSAMMALTVPPRIYVNPWHRYAVITFHQHVS
jgi:hypothetical protein